MPQSEPPSGQEQPIEKEPTDRLRIRLPLHILDKLEELAKEEGISVNRLAGRVIYNYVRKNHKRP